MTSEQLLKAIGSIDESRLEESEQAITHTHRIPIYRWAGVAACACLLLLCLAVPNTLRMGRSYDSDAGAKEFSADSAAITEESEEEYEEDMISEVPAESAEFESVEAYALNDTTSSGSASLYNAISQYESLLINGHSYELVDETVLQKLHLDPSILSALSASDRGKLLGAVRTENEEIVEGAQAYDYLNDKNSAGLILVEFSEENFALYISR